MSILFLLALVSPYTLFGSASAATGTWKEGVQTAIRDADIYSLQRIISSASPSDLATEFCTGLTPLQYAAKTNGATVSTLLAAGCDPLLAHKATGTTPLMFAARSGDIEAVTTLLAVLSSEQNHVDAIDEHESTALGLCSLSCNVKVANLLMTAGADVFKPDASGNTALHVGAYYCAETSGAAFAQALLSNNPDSTLKFINHMSKYGRTALMLAAKKGNAGYEKALLLAKADPSLVSNYDQKTLQDFKLEYQNRLEL
jgi:ankyrin repeat protein